MLNTTSYSKRLVVRVALLVLLMGVSIHAAIYLYQQRLIIPQMLESEQTKADVLLQAYLPVISNAVQSGEEQVQLLVSQLGLIENPVTGHLLLDGLLIEAADGQRWGRRHLPAEAESEHPFVSEAILFSSGEAREMLGVVTLYYSREFFDLLNREARDSLLQLSLLTIALSMVLLIVLAHYLKPLHVLAESLRVWEVGGKPSQLPKLSTSASMEIALVHNAMSRLLDDLHSYQTSLEQLVSERTAELEQHRDHLEQLVESRTAELQVANQKLKEEMVVREQLEKAEQYNAFQSGIAEMSATILHNIGNVVTGMRGSIEKSSHLLKGLDKIARSVHLMHDRTEDGTLEIESVIKGLGLIAPAIKRHSGTEGIQGQLDKMDKGIFHIGEIINVYRSSSKLEINASRFNFQTMLKDSLQLIQDKFDKYEIALEIICPPQLELTIPRNPAIQMLLNLVKNSVEAIVDRRSGEPDHVGKVTIEVRELNESEIELILNDNGCGIESEFQQKIFTHGYTSKNYGSGYGLHSAANFINSIHGSIGVESEGKDQG
ncbi:MAG: hypothetical protein HN344_01915, partial [Gammaproteobacteria bacterium]|nr:hypothetical protein [Gammaproteobacteria bacterium]